MCRAKEARRVDEGSHVRSLRQYTNVQHRAGVNSGEPSRSVDIPGKLPCIQQKPSIGISQGWYFDHFRLRARIG